MPSPSKLLLAITLNLAAISAIGAQCPDGTPPPCDTRRTAPATAIPKRTNPPINDQTWIVLPFNNVTRAPDTEWLSDASVNMLSMDLSRWQDVRVIDDRRVADFMRELSRPAGSKISFNDGVTVARRAGAGRMVIGDVLKVGSRTTVTATVYNVRDGKQIRVAREETALVDSILPLFGKLARQILAVPATDANVGSVGTSRVDAYKEYTAGVQALNRFDPAAAKRNFDAALKLDTNFALAHYKWAIAASNDESAVAVRLSRVAPGDVIGLLNAAEDPEMNRHAAAATRLSSGLPPRERRLMAGLQALVNKDFPSACSAYGSLVAADSSDVEALYGLGSCLIGDDMVIAVNGDTTNLRFRSSWNTAFRVFRRALVVDPTFHLAFDPIVRYLTLPARIGCRHAELVTCMDSTTQARYTSSMVRRGDSLVQIPIAMGKNTIAIEQMMQMLRGQPQRENVEAARAAAADWAAAGPGEGRANKYLAQLLVKLGRPAEAELHLKQALQDPTLAGSPEVWRLRFDIAVKTRRGQEANSILDSIRTALPGQLGSGTFATLGPVVGRLAASDTLYLTAAKQQNLPGYIVEMLVQFPRISLGVAPDTVGGLESAAYANRRTRAVECDPGCLTLMANNYIFGQYIKRTWPKFLPGVDTSRRLAVAIALQRNDTAAVRVAARMLDSLSIATAASGASEDGSSLVAANAYLLLATDSRDSVAALKVLRRMIDTTMLATPVDGVVGVGSVMAGWLWPRAMLLRADLEASVKGGDKEIARALYGDFLSLWSRSDPEFAGLVARVKAAQAKLK